MVSWTSLASDWNVKLLISNNRNRRRLIYIQISWKSGCCNTSMYFTVIVGLPAELWNVYVDFDCTGIYWMIHCCNIFVDKNVKVAVGLVDKRSHWCEQIRFQFLYIWQVEKSPKSTENILSLMPDRERPSKCINNTEISRCKASVCIDLCPYC